MSRVIDRERRLREVVEKLSSSGYRVSSQRAEILKALVNSPVHPSAEDIFLIVRERFPNASLATVYKTIDALKALHQVRMVSIAAGRSHYEVLDLTNHPHVVCTNCGRTEDVDVEPLGDQIRSAAKTSGYALTEERVEFFGLCPSCQSSLNP